MRNTEKNANSNEQSGTQTSKQIQADKNISEILKQEAVLFTPHELGFMFSCLTSLKYAEIDTDDEQDYNNKIDAILNKISRLRA